MEKQTVFRVFIPAGQDDNDIIMGIFSSREKAEEYVSSTRAKEIKQHRSRTYLEIDEWVLDEVEQ